MTKLPPPSRQGAVSIEQAILQRRSVRELRGEPLPLAQVAQLLWACQGVTSPQGLRTAPSAGATFPLEVYLAAGQVDGLDPGVYRYDPLSHDLRDVGVGDRRSALSAAALGQRWVRAAPAVLVICAVCERTTQRYGERGIRYVQMEVGHAGQNVYLQAQSLGLDTVAVGAFREDEVRRALSLPQEHEPFYLMPVGRP